MSVATLTNTDWRSMDSAPKDGTLIILRNKIMAEGSDGSLAEGVEARWGKFRSRNSGFVFTGWHTPCGQFVVPDEWMPVAQEAPDTP